jgi:hypothetical protein
VTSDAKSLTVLFGPKGLTVADLHTGEVEPIPEGMINEYVAARDELAAARSRFRGARGALEAYLAGYGDRFQDDRMRWF